MYTIFAFVLIILCLTCFVTGGLNKPFSKSNKILVNEDKKSRSHSNLKFNNKILTENVNSFGSSAPKRSMFSSQVVSPPFTKKTSTSLSDRAIHQKAIIGKIKADKVTSSLPVRPNTKSFTTTSKDNFWQPFSDNKFASQKRIKRDNTHSRPEKSVPVSEFYPSVASFTDTMSSAGSMLSSFINDNMQPSTTRPLLADITHHDAYHHSVDDSTNRNRKSGSNQLERMPTTASTPIQFNLTAITWNLGEQSPTLKDCAFLKTFSHDDFIVIGIQECENIKPRRTEGSRSRKWRELQFKTLRNTHTCLVEHRLGGMQLAIHCHRRVKDLIKGVQIIDIPCGVGQVLSNKGAIAMLVRLKNNKTLLLVNCHLAAHDKLINKRNQDFHRIVNTITDNAHAGWLKQPASFKSKVTRLVRSGSGVSNRPKPNHPPVKSNNRHRKGLKWSTRSIVSAVNTVSKWSASRALNKSFDAAVLMGDFNYRVDVTRDEIDRLHNKFNKLRSSLKKNITPINNTTGSINASIPLDMRYSANMNVTSPIFQPFRDQLECILDLDQLTVERTAGRIFRGCTEGEILFPPTYKYDKRSSQFDSSYKERCPAWTDRILYTVSNESTTCSNDKNDVTKIVNGGLGLSLIDYLSFDVRSSDHRPVCGTFKFKS